MIKEVKQKRKRENKQKRYQMGFERGEAPSRVEGRALVGQDKAQKPACFRNVKKKEFLHKGFISPSP